MSLPDEINNRGGTTQYTVALKVEAGNEVGKEIEITVQWNEDERTTEIKTATLIPNIP